jgi:hypothetical protein
MMATVALIAQERTVVKVEDLPKAITESLAKDYPGFAVNEAAKIVKEDKTKFEVVITKGATSETLYYDQDGKFLKKKEKEKVKEPGSASSSEMKYEQDGKLMV